MSEDYTCPYPDCDWAPSRPVQSDVGLTQSVVKHEVEQHRKDHSDTSNSPDGS